MSVISMVTENVFSRVTIDILGSAEWLLSTSLHLSINQSIKSGFVKGAGAHPQNALCWRCSHALRKAPIRRGRLLSTVLHR